MTDKMKMPEVGKRYRTYYRDFIKDKEDDYQDIEIIGHWCSVIHYGYVGYLMSDNIMLSKFWNYFQEIPSLEPKKDKVRVALDELKEKINSSYFNLPKGSAVSFSTANIAKKSQNLINALDDSNISEKADSGELSGEHGAPIRKMGGNIKFYTNPAHEIVDDFEEKPKSIWKPVGELKYSSREFVILKYKNGESCLAESNNQEFMELGGNVFCKKTNLEKFCTLTDFINHAESLEQRIKKLEEK